MIDINKILDKVVDALAEEVEYRATPLKSTREDVHKELSEALSENS